MEEVGPLGNVGPMHMAVLAQFFCPIFPLPRPQDSRSGGLGRGKIGQTRTVPAPQVPWVNIPQQSNRCPYLESNKVSHFSAI